jgi:hypothetical protein
MRKTLFVMVLIAGILLAPAMQANAINREWSAALGFLGGWMVANGGLCPRTVVREPVYVERPVYHEPVIVEEPVVMGHYEYREQRIWVPGSWEYIETRRGCVERVWHEGFFRSEMIKVWVNDCPRYSRRSCRW